MITTSYKRDAWALSALLGYCKECRAFQHLSDEVMFGFFLDHVTRQLSGSKPRDKHMEKNIINELSIDCHMRKDDDIRSRFIERMTNALRERKKYYPKWVDSIELKGKHEISEDDAIQKIRLAMSSEKIEPLVKIPGMHWEQSLDCYLDPWVRYDVSSNQGPCYRFWRERAMQRLARAFGVTCPITGELTPPKELRFSYGGTFDHPDRELPDYSWGIPWHKICKDAGAIYSLSDKGKSILKSINKKGGKEFGENPPREWIMAELMQRQLIPQAHRSQLAA